MALYLLFKKRIYRPPILKFIGFIILCFGFLHLVWFQNYISIRPSLPANVEKQLIKFSKDGKHKYVIEWGSSRPEFPIWLSQRFQFVTSFSTNLTHLDYLKSRIKAKNWNSTTKWINSPDIVLLINHEKPYNLTLKTQIIHIKGDNL